MTERFSPEYIDFVTNSEAIQAHWRKRGVRVGDWFVYWIEGSKDKPVLLPLLYGFEYWIARWLPTLSDLLDLIIQANEECDERADLTEVVYCYDDNSWGVADWWDGVVIRDGGWNDDSELAAARLLARVLAGKEER